MKEIIGHKHSGVTGAKEYGLGEDLVSVSPIDESEIGSVRCASPTEFDMVVRDSVACFNSWRSVPAPQRGQLVREVAEELRKHKTELAELITLEVGKIKAEAEGEIQEAIDIAEYAVGLSRQLYGKTMPSERPSHRMFEQWHPLGPVGVITAFNFPAAVWAWNAMIAAVCGDTVIWKPSGIAPLTAVAVNRIARDVAARWGFPALFSLMIDSSGDIGRMIAKDRRIPLVSATGSIPMGRSVAEEVAKRLGRSLLELGGNSAAIVTSDADLDLVVRAVLFGAVGTAGQRCTTTRRLIVEKEAIAPLLERLKVAYAQVKVGDPRHAQTLMGPLINANAVTMYEEAVERSQAEGGKLVFGGKVLMGMPSPFYVEPTLVHTHKNSKLTHDETFAPLLYVMPCSSIEEAIEMNNDVPQGLSSAIFTRDFAKSERFLSQLGSDCGIANVNLGTSGAEIGGAFGGEKDTGGGRESGSDSWQQYMRRQTNTVNYGSELPLAQGIRFGSTPRQE